MKINIKRMLIVFFVLNVGFLYAQEAPAGFEYNQSRFQAFYLYLDAYIDDNNINHDLEDGDWIAAFNDDVCIGSAPWTGEYTSLPIMGDDESQWTVGYLEYGGIPTFKVYDVSSNTYYQAVSSEVYPFENLGTWIINSISVINDCSGTLGGLAFYDDCGTCSGGNSGHIENADQDCQGICF